MHGTRMALLLLKVRVNRRAKMSVKFKKDMKIKKYKKIIIQGNSIFMGQLYMTRDYDKRNMMSYRTRW